MCNIANSALLSINVFFATLSINVERNVNILSQISFLLYYYHGPRKGFVFSPMKQPYILYPKKGISDKLDMHDYFIYPLTF